MFQVPRLIPKKWTAALVPEAAAELYATSIGDETFEPLSAWGSTDLGIVIGNSIFFTLTAEEFERFGLGSADSLSISPPGSRHLWNRRPHREQLAQARPRRFIGTMRCEDMASAFCWRASPSDASIRFLSLAAATPAALDQPRMLRGDTPVSRAASAAPCVTYRSTASALCWSV